MGHYSEMYSDQAQARAEEIERIKDSILADLKKVIRRVEQFNMTQSIARAHAVARLHEGRMWLEQVK